MKDDWPLQPLGELGSSVRVAATIAEGAEYELWSVPSFANDEPEVVTGREIGSSKLLVSPGDILICKINPRINRVWRVREPVDGRTQIASPEWLVFRPSEHSGLQPGWFIHFLSSPKFREWIEAGVTGATGSHTRAKAEGILAQRVPVPPLPEQRHIVAILDEAFEAIATAKDNTEKNLQNAREVFESALDAALSRHDGGHVETTLGDEIDLLAGYAFSSKGYTDAADGIRLLRGDNIMQGYLRWDDAKAWPANDVGPYTRFALREGDVVLAMDRPWVKAGLKRAQIGVDDLPCLQLQRTARLRPKRRMSVNFLYHLTGSKSFSEHLLGVQTGLGVPHISGKQIESFRFMLPPQSAQETIASTLDDLQQRSQRLEEIYQQKVTALDELKKTLLHQAFTGQLTAKQTDRQLEAVA